MDDVKKALSGLLKPDMKEVITGEAEVRKVFRLSRAGTVAGSYVLSGSIARNASVRVKRDGEVVFEGKISSLKRIKDDVKQVASGFDCGIGLEGFDDVQEKDIIEAFGKLRTGDKEATLLQFTEILEQEREDLFEAAGRKQK